ncbi:glycosyltransferase family 2 protein [Candidatus Marithrix sp. Canyon 246]|uniref:glycosyltransferase family 2 protein n=1 Tax=Candidatus Marithrix sp. Canyon 246 TaxID=1827136 RepID=UPI00084A0EFC|nr:glycosyltransferase family 2 protein [Candidatus Marithrix sp. Canyon 246]
MAVESVVSVIIVNFNAGKLLSQCVNSVLASNIPVSIYIIDNASQDNSLKYLEAVFDKIKLIKNSSNLGFARAANQVLADTIKSKYLLFLNPDCVIQPDTIGKFVAVMDKNPQAGMAGCVVRNPDGSEQRSSRRSVPTPWRTIIQVFHLNKFFQSFLLTNQELPTQPIAIEGISGSCMFVRRTALDIVGAMDETYFLHCEDLDWFMRFGAKNFSILFIPNIEIVHFKGVCSSKNPIKVEWYKHRGMVKFYRKFFRHKYPFIVFWGVITMVWLRFIGVAIRQLFKK